MTSYSNANSPSVILQGACGTLAAPAAIQGGDPILNFTAKGYDTGFKYGVQIMGKAETNWATSAGTSDPDFVANTGQGGAAVTSTLTDDAGTDGRVVLIY